MSDESGRGGNQSTPLRCRLLGHDWYYRVEERVCDRCGATAPNDRERTDDDPDAEVGDVRFSIEQEDDGQYRVMVEHYRKTARGPDSEYYQWFASTVTTVDREGLEKLGGVVVQALDIEDQFEVSNSGE